MDKVLIAEDEKVTRLSLCKVLQKEGFMTIEAENGAEAVDLFHKEAPLAVVLDLKMPVMDGAGTIARMKEIAPEVPVIIVTAYGDVPTAVECMKLGAHDFLCKPVEPGKLIMAVRRAVEKLRLEQELKRLQASEEASLEWAIGKSPAMKAVIEQTKKVSPSSCSVILQGGDRYRQDVSCKAHP